MSVDKREADVRVNALASSRRDQSVCVIDVSFENVAYRFIVRIVNKELRCRESYSFFSELGMGSDGQCLFLVNEIAVRTQLELRGLSKLVALRNSDLFVFFCRIELSVLK